MLCLGFRVRLKETLGGEPRGAGDLEHAHGEVEQGGALLVRGRNRICCVILFLLGVARVSMRISFAGSSDVGQGCEGEVFLVELQVDIVHGILVVAVWVEGLVLLQAARQKMHDAEVQDEALDFVGWKAIAEGPVPQGKAPVGGFVRPEVADEGYRRAGVAQVVNPREEEQQYLHGLLVL